MSSLSMHGCGAALLLFAASSLTGCASMKTRDLVDPDRPDFTETAGIVERGHVQLESGHTQSRSGDVRGATTGEVLVRAGLASWVELRVLGNSFVREVEGASRLSGREDAGIGAKVRLFDSGSERPSWRPALVSLIAQSQLPSGAGAFRGVRAQPQAKLVTRWILGEETQFTTNMNATRAFDDRAYTQYDLSGSLGHGWNDRFGSYVESFVLAAPRAFGGSQTFVAGGVTFALSPDLQFDLRAGRAPRHADTFAGVGLVLRR